MSELFVLGLSWRTAPVAIRERLAFSGEEHADLLGAVLQGGAATEAMLISTCNRVELYGAAPNAQAALQRLRPLLIERRAIEGAMRGDVERALYQHVGPDAVRHVFRVASSLDSLVLGEAQILGQLKDAYGQAQTARSLGTHLGRCLERAFAVAKRVRTETPIARGAANVSSVAVELATKVFGHLDGKSVLVIGAGKMSALAARHLHDDGARELVVTNRSPERAQALADEVGGRAAPWADLEQLLAHADVVISSTGAREPILTKALFKKVVKARKYRPLMVVDIAVPRDAEPAIGELEGVYLFDIDDLDKVVQGNLAERGRASEQAAHIVEREAAQFEQWQKSQDVVPTIRALRARFTEVAEAEVAKLLDQLRRSDLAAAKRDEAVARLGQLIVNKLLHAPQLHLRDCEPEVAAARAQALAELFELDLDAAPTRQSTPPVAEKKTAT